MKFKLYSTLSGWTSRNSSLETHLGIPDGDGTLRYAEVSQVTNPANADYEKYIMPVCMDGTWKCNQLFKQDDLVDWDVKWQNPDVPE
jgi:hypothetical protein